MSFGVGLLSQTDEVILSQLCSKAKTGQSSKALGKESTESKENRAEYIQSLSPQQLNNPCLRLLSALPNKTSPSTPLAYPQVNRTPSEALGSENPVWGTIKKCTHTSPMCTRSIALFTSRWNVLWNSHPSLRLAPNLVLLALFLAARNKPWSKQTGEIKERKCKTRLHRGPSGFKPKDWCFKMALLQNSLLKARLFVHESGLGIFQLLQQSLCQLESLLLQE